MAMSSDMSDKVFHQQLQQTRNYTPRYLFRFWTSESGGDRRLNTKDAITPRAFLKREGPQSITKMSQVEIRKAWFHHYQHVAVETVFSSWSQSAAYALSMAVGSSGNLSVIDTTGLEKENVVLWTGAPEAGQLGLPGDQGEFLVFGIVTGEAHKAVSLESLEKTTPLPRSSYGEASWPTTGYGDVGPKTVDDLQELLPSIFEAGTLYGSAGGIGLAFACECISALGVVDEAAKDYIISALADADSVPVDWMELQDLPSVAPRPNALSPTSLMREAATRKYGTTDHSEDVGVQKGPETDHGMNSNGGGGTLTAHDAADTAASTKKVPRAIRELDIDIKGW